MWPFGKKSETTPQDETEGTIDAVDSSAQDLGDGAVGADQEAKQAPGTTPSMYSLETVPGVDESEMPRLTKSGGGPFDLEDAGPEKFDFSDFAKASLNLGSVVLPIPHQGDIQVEMGPQGPTMLHVATQFGRVTPVAFAAPTSGGQWESSAAEIRDGLAQDGLDVSVEQGPWGSEVVGRAGDMELRIIGADGYRWMLRMTASGPAEHAEALAHIARGILARSFVSRGDDPMPAGQPLPVTLPPAMAGQIRAAYQQQTAAPANPGQVPGAQAINPDGSTD
nr:DUF3710 domain-containing protein [Corynebacterium lactis]